MNREITRSEFKDLIKTTGLTIVKFHAEWSGPCQMILPVYDELSKNYFGRAKFYSIDITNEEALKREYGVLELPTILFFRNGVVTDHITGIFSRNALIAKLENAIGSINN